MIGTGWLWIDDNDGNRFAALASQLIMANQTRPMTLMKGGILGPVALPNISQFPFSTAPKLSLRC